MTDLQFRILSENTYFKHKTIRRFEKKCLLPRNFNSAISIIYCLYELDNVGEFNNASFQI